MEKRKENKNIIFIIVVIALLIIILGIATIITIEQRNIKIQANSLQEKVTDRTIENNEVELNNENAEKNMVLGKILNNTTEKKENELTNLMKRLKMDSHVDSKSTSNKNISDELIKTLNKLYQNKQRPTEKVECVNHIYQSISSKEATCAEEGLNIFECIVCGNKKYESISKKEHEYVDEIVKEAISEEEGLMRHTCKNCGKIEEEIIAKLEKTDLEILRENLLNESISVEELGQEMHFNEIDILTDIRQFKQTIMSEDLNEESEVIMNNIIFNEKEYTITIDENNIIIDVVEHKELFRFGSVYEGEDHIFAVSIEKNGKTIEYRIEEKTIRETDEATIIYQNVVYAQYNENEYTKIGKVIEEGEAFIIGEVGEEYSLIYRYNPDFDTTPYYNNEGEETIETPIESEVSTTTVGNKIELDTLSNQIEITEEKLEIEPEIPEVKTLETETLESETLEIETEESIIAPSDEKMEEDN